MRSVMSLRLRVKSRTSSPSRWACTRAPSSFHSTDAAPVAASASPTSPAVDASIGCTATPTRSPTASSASAPSVSASRGGGGEVARQHRGPSHLRRGHPRGLRDGVGHDAGQRTLAQLAEEQPAEEVGLVWRGPSREVVEQLAPPCRRARAGGDRQLVERRRGDHRWSATARSRCPRSPRSPIRRRPCPAAGHRSTLRRRARSRRAPCRRAGRRARRSSRSVIGCSPPRRTRRRGQPAARVDRVTATIAARGPSRRRRGRTTPSRAPTA